MQTGSRWILATFHPFNPLALNSNKDEGDTARNIPDNPRKPSDFHLHSHWHGWYGGYTNGTVANCENIWKTGLDHVRNVYQLCSPSSVTANIFLNIYYQDSWVELADQRMVEKINKWIEMNVIPGSGTYWCPACWWIELEKFGGM